MIEFLMTDEQKELQSVIRNFAEKEIEPRAAEFDRKGELDMETYKKAVEMGLNSIAWPEEYGGPGLDGITQVIIVEELYRADAGFANALGGSTLACRPILIGGNSEQKKYAADIVVSGGFAAFALTESNAGSDTAAIKTSAYKVGDEYIINGTKHFITNGDNAEFYVVFAVTDKEKGAKGLSAFIVERDRDGVSVGKHEDKMGIRQSSATEVIFNEVKVPAKNLIGAENKAFKLAMESLNFGRVDIAAGAVGISQKAIDLSIKYAKERITFGKPIYKHQAIGFMIADMEIQTQASRALVWQAAALGDVGALSSKLCSCAKTMAGDTVMKVTTDAVQVYSAFGYSREFGVEKLMRDAKIFQIFEGTNQIQRIVISGSLFK